VTKVVGGTPAAVRLTDEQQSIVDHDLGPALVFAVAGAGKTTTMVRRIERLVRERIFKPERILAASFSKATVNDLKKALSAFPHAGTVHFKTLHGLAYQILRDAQKLKLGPELKLPEDVEAAPHVILNGALNLARSSRASFLAELDSLDREDFFAYVGGCKATLAFTKERYRELPHGSMATEAGPPATLSWYLGLFKLFEGVRLDMGVLTFDDLVPEAWARLVQYPALTKRYQDLYDAVLVDEFQDTNLSQVELLDILVSSHKNVMVCGDDDQGIFGFRKASNSFILGFAKRYGAVTYRISDNFRCFAEHTILANHVIQRNKVRAPKQLSPVRGFGGATVIASHESADEMGTQIAENVRNAIDQGLRPDHVAVLVRLYAETGAVETALIEEGIPYQIVGNVPFYDRPENTLLLKYLQVALIERRAASGPMSAADKAQLSEVWWDVLRTPKRYARRDAADTLLKSILIHDTPPSVALLTAGGMSGFAGPKLVALGQTLTWLVKAIEKGASAYALLIELETRLEYKKFLVENSGFVETGQGKAQNVEAFIEYTRGKGDASSLLAQIERARAAHNGSRGAQVVISSIFRAKGLEWPHVIVPAVNYGHIPAAGNDTDLSEERRLFYVALTRTKATLELHVVKNRPPSIFMEGLSSLRNAAQASREAFNIPCEQWGATEAVAVAEVYRYVDRYVDVWSNMEAPERQQLTEWVLAANKAWGMKSTTPLPHDLERRLTQVALPNESKVKACAHKLGVLHRLDKQAPPKTTNGQQRPYNFKKDGRLTRGTQVWHKLHGIGNVTYTGVEKVGEVVEITFDKGRTAKFVAELAGLDILE
jgi:DNA helicase-2/ATP-dependent DNA helicase PcrA